MKKELILISDNIPSWMPPEDLYFFNAIQKYYAENYASNKALYKSMIDMRSLIDKFLKLKMQVIGIDIDHDILSKLDYIWQWCYLEYDKEAICEATIKNQQPLFEAAVTNRKDIFWKPIWQTMDYEEDIFEEMVKMANNQKLEIKNHDQSMILEKVSKYAFTELLRKYFTEIAEELTQLNKKNGNDSLFPASGIDLLRFLGSKTYLQFNENRTEKNRKNSAMNEYIFNALHSQKKNNDTPATKGTDSKPRPIKMMDNQAMALKIIEIHRNNPHAKIIVIADQKSIMNFQGKAPGILAALCHFLPAPIRIGAISFNMQGPSKIVKSNHGVEIVHIYDSAWGLYSDNTVINLSSSNRPKATQSAPQIEDLSRERSF